MTISRILNFSMNWIRCISSTSRMLTVWEEKVSKFDPGFYEDPAVSGLLGTSKYNVELASMANNTVVISEPGKVITEIRKIPDINSGDILIRMGGVMLNEADVQLATYGRAGGSNNMLNGPLVPGSHAGGVVVSTFGETSRLNPGDRVLLDPRCYCGSCHQCDEEKFASCPEYSFSGIPPKDGFLTQYVVHPADFCYKIPDDMSIMEACTVPTIARCYNLYRGAGINSKTNLLVYGGGILGLTVISIAKLLGVDKIFAADPSMERLIMCKDYGADFLLNVKPYVEPKQLKPIVRTALGRPVDVTFCSTVTSNTVENAIHVTKAGGKIILAGINPSSLDCNFRLLTEKQQTIMGNQDPGDKLETCLKIMEKKILNFLSLTPLTFPIYLTPDAFSAASHDIPTFPLVYIRCNFYVR